MKTAFLLFFVLILLSLNARAQQTFNSLKIKDLELPNGTVSKALYLDGDKKVKTSNVDFSELEYVDGVTSNIQTQIDTNATNIALKANIASPTFTGVPAAPTAAAATNTTQLATTAFVTTAVASATDPTKVSGVASSVDGEIALFDSTTGKLIKRATGTGYVKATSGVYSTSSTVATSDLTGTVPLANGGTNKNITAVPGGVTWTDADSLEVSAAGSSGQFLISGGTGAPTWSSVTPGAPQVATLYDQKTVGTQGGTFTGGSWQTRTLNTEDDTAGIVTLTANQFTLTAGTYYIEAKASVYNVTYSKSRIQNITDGTTALNGSTDYFYQVSGFSISRGTITIAGTKTFELQHITGSTVSTNGYGITNTGFSSPEIYSSVTILKR